jgi:hypothetical protein
LTVKSVQRTLFLKTQKGALEQTCLFRGAFLRFEKKCAALFLGQFCREISFLPPPAQTNGKNEVGAEK